MELSIYRKGEARGPLARTRLTPRTLIEVIIQLLQPVLLYTPGGTTQPVNPGVEFLSLPNTSSAYFIRAGLRDKIG